MVFVLFDVAQNVAIQDLILAPFAPFRVSQSSNLSKSAFDSLIINDIDFLDYPEWDVISIKTISTLCLDIIGFCIESNVFVVTLSACDAPFQRF